MSDQSTPSIRRPLFTGGEQLRLRVEPSNGGGPGEKYHPQTAAQARTILLPQIREVVHQAELLPRRLRGDLLYVEAKLLPNYLAPSHSPDRLLDHIGAVPVGSRADHGTLTTANREATAVTRRLVLAVDDPGLDRLEQLISHSGPGRSGGAAFEEIRKLEGISVASPADIIINRPDSTELITWEAVLHPSGVRGGRPVELDPVTLEKWFDLVERLGGRSHRDYVRTVGGLTFAPAQLSPEYADALARFNPLRALRPMPTIRPRPVFGTRSTGSIVPPTTLVPANAGPRTAVFDGGIDFRTPSLLFAAPATDLTTEPEESDAIAHGTAVTAAVSFGLAATGEQVSPPPCPIDSFRVLPAVATIADLHGYAVLDEILRAVVAGDYSLVNLSLGPELAVEDMTEPNRWTAELDQLAWEHDVLFVVAAGNFGEQDPTTGLNRVQVPGDMVNGLTIGACDVPAPTMPWSATSYSSVGPGRHGNRIQPASVQFGGTDTLPFPTIMGDGRIIASSGGTSFSAPLVTHAIAVLDGELPRGGANVWRAFTVHFSERHRTFKKLVDQIGHGRAPLSFEDHLECGPNEAHILFDDEIARGEILGYEIPLPRGLNVPIELRLTLSYMSAVQPTEITEYTQSALEVALRPHHLLHSFQAPKGNAAKSQILDMSSDAAATLLSQGWKPSQEPVTKTLSAPPGSAEVKLREAGKWETVRHHRVKLAAADVDQPRIEVSYTARRSGSRDQTPADVPFALLVTVVDTSNIGVLYDRVEAEYSVLRPIVRAQSDARIRT